MFKIFGFTKKNKEIIRRCYLTALEREPDEVGLNHYLKMMRSIIKPNGIDEKKLIKILKESGEGKKVKLAKVYDHKPPYVFTGLYNIKYWIRPNSVLDNASKICRSDGRFFLASRLSMYDAERNEYVDKHEELGQEIAKQHPNVDVVRTTYIPMIQEQGMHGIQIDSRLQLPDGSLLPIPMDLKDVTYSLYLFDMRVR